MRAPTNGARLSRGQVTLLSVSGLALWLSGVLWLLLHNFGQVQGPFGPQAHPLEPWMLRLHGAAMLAFLLGTGGLLITHVWSGWRHRQQRWVGASLLCMVTVLTITGYLLYYLPGDDARNVVSEIHWIAGVPSLGLFLWHYLRRRLRQPVSGRSTKRPSSLR